MFHSSKTTSLLKVACCLFFLAALEGCTGDTCKTDDQCRPGLLCQKSKCVAPTCTDGVKNGNEADVDCGGSDCNPCKPGAHCNRSHDCTSRVCDVICRITACDDGIQNGDETAIDCGGSCENKCEVNEVCKLDGDCKTNHCIRGICQEEKCNDGIKNGDEIGVDCGGANCAPCASGLGCTKPADCASKVCTDGKCIDPTCTDKVANGDETDADCGGKSCKDRCANDKACKDNSDCASGICSQNVCVECITGDSISGNDLCQKTAAASLECRSYACQNNKCMFKILVAGGSLTSKQDVLCYDKKCDVDGKILMIPNDSRVATSSNPCEQPACLNHQSVINKLTMDLPDDATPDCSRPRCINGERQEVPKDLNTRCGEKGYCRGTDTTCDQCHERSQCDAKSDYDVTCANNSCAYSCSQPSCGFNERCGSITNSCGGHNDCGNCPSGYICSNTYCRKLPGL